MWAVEGSTAYPEQPTSQILNGATEEIRYRKNEKKKKKSRNEGDCVGHVSVNESSQPEK